MRWQGLMQFRAYIRVKMTAAAIYREASKIQVTIARSTVTTDMLRINLRYGKRKHRPVFHNGTWVTAKLRIKALSTQNILSHLITTSRVFPIRFGRDTKKRTPH